MCDGAYVIGRQCLSAGDAMFGKRVSVRSLVAATHHSCPYVARCHPFLYHSSCLSYLPGHCNTPRRPLAARPPTTSFRHATRRCASTPNALPPPGPRPQWGLPIGGADFNSLMSCHVIQQHHVDNSIQIRSLTPSRK